MEESLLPSRTIQTGSVVPCTIKRLVWSLMLNLFLEEACTSETSPVAPTIARRNSPGIELTSLINHRETINSVIIKDLSLFIWCYSSDKLICFWSRIVSVICLGHSCNFWYSQKIDIAIKLVKLRQAGHVARVEKIWIYYIILLGNYEGKALLRRPKHWYKDYIKTNINDISWEAVAGFKWLLPTW